MRANRRLTSRSIKGTLKELIPKLSARMTRDARGRRVVLCYHSVHPSKPAGSITPAGLERHLDWLVEHCDVVPLHEIAPTVQRTGAERPAVALTFDDGYADNYEFAFPLLHQRRLHATFFVTAGFVDKDPQVLARMWMLRRQSYGGVAPLDWSQAKEMHAGGMEIGAHTYSHANLALLGRRAATEELRRSKEVIEQRLGTRIRAMAYPFGKPSRHFTSETVALARELGYERACAVLFRAVRPSDSDLAIPRFFVDSESVASLHDRVMGAWDLLGLWQEKAPLWVARIVSPRDFIE